ncbi:MAG TPA: hypothetical protein VL460_00780 [Caulobacteraceae bacterium]|jgi:hypothetical protein|nr:hypothetical protein [Caulobacteraceae bacterium]
MKPRTIKTLGYLISSLSVLLLGVASWSGLAGKPVLQLCLALGMAASIAGMACRWLSYQIEKDGEAQAGGPANAPATTTAAE